MSFSKHYITSICNVLFWMLRNHCQFYQWLSHFHNSYLVLRNKCSKTMEKMMELHKQLQMGGHGSMSGFGDSNIIHTETD